MRSFTLIPLAIGVLLSAAAGSQSVEDVVAQYLEATGGSAKWAALQSLTVASRSPFFSFDSAWKLPNRFRFDAWSDQSAETDARAFDGTSGWRLNSMEGSSKPRTMSAQEIAGLKEELDWMLELVDYKTKGHKVTLLGTTMVEGQPAHRLEVTRASGAQVQIFLSTKTGLEIQRTKRATSPDGENVELVLPVGDYRAVGGLLLPHRVGPAVRTYQVNAQIPDSRFSRPGDPTSTAAKPRLSEQEFAKAKVADATKRLLPLGSAAPPWTLKDASGRVVRSSDFRGKLVVMDFWATWCVPCHIVMPQLEDLHREFSSRGVVVVGISTSEQGGDPAQLMKDRGYTYPLLLNGESISEQYHVVGMPVLYVVDGDGRILHAEVGAEKSAAAPRRAVIGRYLAKNGR